MILSKLEFAKKHFIAFKALPKEYRDSDCLSFRATKNLSYPNENVYDYEAFPKLEHQESLGSWVAKYRGMYDTWIVEIYLEDLK